MTTNAKPYNSADEKQVANAKRLVHNDTQAEIKDLRATMNTREGRNTIWRMLSRCGVFQHGFINSNDFLQFKEGKRDLGLIYIELLHEHCYEKYKLMENENGNTQ